MKTLRNGSIVGASLLSLLVTNSPALARTRSEDELIQDLRSPSTHTVDVALGDIEKDYPATTRALPEMKKLLTDPRDKVRRKAARVLGDIHADVDQPDIDAICELLNSNDPREAIDALKSLRGLDASSAVPRIIPLLENSNPHVARDACRTLGVLGSRNTIPSIQPLVNNPNPAVRREAQEAINELRSKP